ncbi:hypothetical protein HMPREF9306_00318 [Propionimicrobium lymphophilum ACS-093-V-SCH5]|uniref:STAS domain-containing protein n=1 Tax=Propionimicrobium lymphophilum ACS-093-V-SCH5 TaxID=883161 RepID=S2X0M3_9ACTN|nr:SulP family inorganic anion transporter [Propionimicrobium lymphophilum]EPD33564.1 hypothetical protein HMPREF9306_00318 [Propionimicrobium lymphophilum ACS-093-V-SCH5]
MVEPSDLARHKIFIPHPRVNTAEPTAVPQPRKVYVPAVLNHLRSLLPNVDDLSAVKKYWRQDIPAGITVGIVALPLALAFAISSGLSAEAGLITAIIAGIIAAVFGGSNYQISGPTGAMAVILAPIVAAHGVHVVPLLCVMAGTFIVLGGLLGLGRAVSLIPWPVIEGFTLGIAAILFFQQVPNIIGVEAKSGLSTLPAAFEAIARIDPTTATKTGLTCLASIVVIAVCSKISRKLPGSLIAVVVVTLAVWAMGVSIPTIGTIPNSLPAPIMPEFSIPLATSLLQGSLAVAALAGIESLISARIAAGMVRGGSYSPDRELVGQGLASVASGMFGGMPATGAIVRTAVNVRSGGRSRLSSIVHSLLLVGVVYLASTVVSVIPLSVLAGVLVVTCFRMVDPDTIRQVMRSNRSDALVFVVTTIITVGLDIIWAIAAGIVVSGVLVLRRMANRSGIFREDLPSDPKIAILRIDGTMFFGVGDRIERELPRLAGVDVVILRLSRVGIVDATGVRVLAQIVGKLVDAGNTVLLKGMPKQVHEMAKRMELEQVSLDEYLFADLPSAIAKARQIVATGESHSTATGRFKAID